VSGSAPDVLAVQIADARCRAAEASADAARFAALIERARAMPAAPSFRDALARPGVSVIAEIKRGSPSKGPLNGIPDVAGLAAAYRDGGAAAVSVLTAPIGFLGSLEDLANVAATGVPALRKDFIVDAVQIWEARVAGAAAVLLLAVALDDADLERLMSTAEEAGLDVLLEVHDDVEMARAARLNPAIVGVNVRDLRDFSVDTARFSALAAARPDGALLVAESGVNGPQDVVAYGDAGADAVLVGEHLVTSANPQAATAALVAAGSRTGSAQSPGGPATRVAANIEASPRSATAAHGAQPQQGDGR
jgi:indole-3-glycerol phosphate synthase